MEQKPHKKDELTLANNVLKLAEALLKVYLDHDLKICKIMLKGKKCFSALMHSIYYWPNYSPVQQNNCIYSYSFQNVKSAGRLLNWM